MFRVVVQSEEKFDDELQEFVPPKYYSFQIEHSLVSISKWESKWHKPFLSNVPKSDEEVNDYIRCMTITQNVSDEAYENISQENFVSIREYIDNPMTATNVKHEEKGRNRDIITSEKIYYWMIALGVPFECQKWHLNRLLMLIDVCNAENKPKKKMSRKDLMSRNASLNAARRKQLNSKG